jgi:hypothetical protein
MHVKKAPDVEELRKKTYWPRVAPNDLGGMLVYAIRYALHRRTYAPAEVCGWVRTYWDDVDKTDRDIIRRDVEREVELSEAKRKNVGDDATHVTWATLVKWIRDGESES